MIHEVLGLDIDYKALGIEHNDVMPTMTTYLLENYPNVQGERTRPLVIVCPGGGYDHHSPREGEALAIKMNNFGFDAIVLRYSLAPNIFPCPLYEAAYTVKYVRDHAKEWSINPDKVFIAGFSAGGHVAASLGTLWNQPELAAFIENGLHCTPKDVRPDGMLLGYSVLTAGRKAHRKSFERLLGSRYDDLIDAISLELRVNEGTPQSFIWHTFEDDSVPVENSMLFAQALKEHDIHFELHIFPRGSHGIGLATKETDMANGTKSQPECAVWPELFRTWVESMYGPVYE